MKYFTSTLLVVATFAVIAVACKKSTVDTPAPPAEITEPALSLARVQQCSWSPDYGDSILYAQPQNQALVMPLNHSFAGKYCSFPTGLNIDSVSGAINPNKSESGMRYMVGFVKTGSVDTCFSSIVIGGASYIDSMYVMSGSQSLALPSYNADINASPVCNNSGEDDNGNGDNKCKFGSSNKLVKLRSVSGAIDLQKTVSSGAFGVIPFDGATAMTTITYSLNDKSNKATRNLNVKLIYYFRRASIPKALSNTITANRNASLQNDALRTSPRPPIIVVSYTN